MPFTPCHAAAAVPLRRLGLPLSALVVGSMSPDFLYYIVGVQHTAYGHSLQGLFVFSLPASLVVLAAFHALLKWPLLSLLPELLQSRLEPLAAQPFEWRGGRRLAIIVCAAFVGAVSHILWDGFTHYYGLGVQLFPELRERVSVGPFRTRIFYILQDLSTLVGGALLLLWCLLWLRRAAPQPVTARVRRTTAFKVGWTLGLLLPAIAIGFAASLGILSQGYHPIRRFVVTGLIATITTLAIMIVGFAIFQRQRVAAR
jgi:Domain of unknown function (DUF4184)